MAAYCPKCNYKLKISDWRPECPACGVNVVYYGIEDRLREEADAAEHHYAVNKPKYDRLKFALIGHPLCIVRIVLGLLPIVALLLPMGQLKYTVQPLVDRSVQVNLVSVISFIADYGLDFDALAALAGSKLLGAAMICWAVALVSMVLMMLTALVGFFMLTLSASPKGFPRNIGFAVTGMTLATAAFVSFCVMVNKLNAALPGVFTGRVLPWAYVAVMAVYAAIIAVNVIYKRKNIQVKYTDVSELLLPYHERPSTKAKQGAKAEAAAAAE